MKKIALVLAMLLFAAPAMAALTVGCEIYTGTNTCTVWYNAGGGTLPRAFALDISLDSGATISNAPTADPTADFYIYPTSIDVNDNGTVDSWGTPVVTGGNGSSTMTVEMGSLYASNDTDHSSAPPSYGTLFTFDVSAACKVTITENSARGGVAMEDGEDDGLSNPVSTCEEPCACKGNVSGSTPGSLPIDSALNAADVITIIQHLQFGSKSVVTCPTAPTDCTCGDIAGALPESLPVDGKLMVSDVLSLISWLQVHGSKGQIACPWVHPAH